jgi:hypothetical protein
MLDRIAHGAKLVIKRLSYFTYFCPMESVRVEILNPKAKALLKSLADLKLISINENFSSFAELLKKLRRKSASALSLEDITKEVESVRSKRYGK